MANSVPVERSRVLVTGGTGTLGSAIVRRLCERGYAVTANYLRDEDRAELLARETGCHLFRTDVSEEQGVEDLLGSDAAAMCAFDHVVHCAGWNRDGLLARQSASGWKNCWRQNAESAFLVVRQCLRVLPAGGHVLVLSSRVGKQGYAGQSAYAAAKGAVTGLVVAAASEARERGLYLNCIFPGFVPSALSSSTAPRALGARAAAACLPGADASVALAEFVVWELQHNRTCGQVFCPDFRMERGGPT